MSIVYMTIAKPILERIFAFYNHTTASAWDNTLFKCSVNNRISSILNLILDYIHFHVEGKSIRIIDDWIKSTLPNKTQLVFKEPL